MMDLERFAELSEHGRKALLDMAQETAQAAADQIADLLILQARLNAWGHMPEVVEIEFRSDPDVPDLFITDARLADGTTYFYGRDDALAELVNDQVEEVLREAQGYAGNRRFEPYGDQMRHFRITMPGR